MLFSRQLKKFSTRPKLNFSSMFPMLNSQLLDLITSETVSPLLSLFTPQSLKVLKKIFILLLNRCSLFLFLKTLCSEISMLKNLSRKLSIGEDDIEEHIVDSARRMVNHLLSTPTTPSMTDQGARSPVHTSEGWSVSSVVPQEMMHTPKPIVLRFVATFSNHCPFCFVTPNTSLMEVSGAKMEDKF